MQHGLGRVYIHVHVDKCNVLESLTPVFPQSLFDYLPGNVILTWETFYLCILILAGPSLLCMLSTPCRPLHYWYVVPLLLALCSPPPSSNHPMFLTYILLSLSALFKSYPCVGDLTVPLALLPLWSHTFRCKSAGVLALVADLPSISAAFVLCSMVYCTIRKSTPLALSGLCCPYSLHVSQV